MTKLKIFFTCIVRVLALLPILNCTDDHLKINVGVGLPVLEDGSAGENILAPLLMSSLSTGVGYQENIIEDIFSPGIYGDIHFGDIFSQYQTGIRLYNQFRFDDFDLYPFIGLNSMYGSFAQSILAMYGILIGYKIIGLEYSYQPLILSHSDLINKNIYRIVFVVRILR